MTDDRTSKYKRRLQEHGEAATLLRDAQKAIAEKTRMERRIAEVDAREGGRQTEVLEVPLLAVEGSDGTWNVETTTQCFPSMGQKIVAQHRNINIAICDLRQVLKERLISDRYVRESDVARKMAAIANCWLAGKVPFSRIVSK